MRPFFRFAVGNIIQLAKHSRIQQVTWRGKQWVPDPRGGKPYQVPVYRLDNGYWDCYYEDELHSALRWAD